MNYNNDYYTQSNGYYNNNNYYYNQYGNNQGFYHYNNAYTPYHYQQESKAFQNQIKTFNEYLMPAVSNQTKNHSGYITTHVQTNTILYPEETMNIIKQRAAEAVRKKNKKVNVNTSNIDIEVSSTPQATVSNNIRNKYKSQYAHWGIPVHRNIYKKDKDLLTNAPSLPQSKNTVNKVKTNNNSVESNSINNSDANDDEKMDEKNSMQVYDYKQHLTLLANKPPKTPLLRSNSAGVNNVNYKRKDDKSISIADNNDKNNNDNNGNNGSNNGNNKINVEQIAPPNASVQSVISPNGGVYHPCHGFSHRTLTIFDLFPNIVKYQSKKYNEGDRAKYLMNMAFKPFVSYNNQQLNISEKEMWFTALKYLFNDITMGTFQHLSKELLNLIKLYMSKPNDRYHFLKSVATKGFNRTMAEITKKYTKLKTPKKPIGKANQDNSGKIVIKKSSATQIVKKNEPTSLKYTTYIIGKNGKCTNVIESPTITQKKIKHNSKIKTVETNNINGNKHAKNDDSDSDSVSPPPPPLTTLKLKRSTKTKDDESKLKIEECKTNDKTKNKSNDKIREVWDNYLDEIISEQKCKDIKNDDKYIHDMVVKMMNKTINDDSDDNDDDYKNEDSIRDDNFSKNDTINDDIIKYSNNNINDDDIKELERFSQDDDLIMLNKLTNDSSEEDAKKQDNDDEKNNKANDIIKTPESMNTVLSISTKTLQSTSSDNINDNNNNTELINHNININLMDDTHKTPNISGINYLNARSHQKIHNLDSGLPFEWVDNANIWRDNPYSKKQKYFKLKYNKSKYKNKNNNNNSMFSHIK